MGDKLLLEDDGWLEVTVQVPLAAGANGEEGEEGPAHEARSALVDVYDAWDRWYQDWEALKAQGPVSQVAYNEAMARWAGSVLHAPSVSVRLASKLWQEVRNRLDALKKKDSPAPSPEGMPGSLASTT